MTININDEKISINKREIKLLSHALKKLTEESRDVQRIANGDKRTKTLIKIYLTENIKIIFKKPIDIIVFIIPLIEKKVSDSSSMDINEFEISIKFEKAIYFLQYFLLMKK